MKSTSLPLESERVTIAAALALGTLGAAVLLVLPGLVGELKHGYGFDDSQLGYLSSADLLGLTLGAALGARLVAQMGIRQSAYFGGFFAAVANLTAIAATSYWPLLLLRTAAGLGAGVVLAVCYTVLGRTRQVDRNFSLYLVCQLLFGAVALKWMPVMSNLVGVSGMFCALAALFVLGLLLPRYLPSSSGNPSSELPQGRVERLAAIALVATLIYFMAQGAVWAYLELVGERHGIARETVAGAVSVSSLAGLSGPAIAAVWGARWDRAKSLLAGVFGSLAALYLLNSSHDAMRFVGAACLFVAAWNFTVPYQLATIAAVDRSGKAVGWSASISLTGLALGPFLAAHVLAVSGFTAVLGISAALCVLSLAGFALALRGKDKIPVGA